MNVTVTAFITLLVAIILTAAIRRVALRTDVVDHPGNDRKIHTKKTPLLGGVAVIIAFLVGIVMIWPELMGGYMLPKHVFSVIAGAIIILAGGALDDKYNLSPKVQIIFPLLAALVIVAAGIGIDYITNPFGGIIALDIWQIKLFEYNGLPYHFTVLADIFAFLWLLGMIYTTKFLDGMDGLVSGITVIGMVVLFWLSLKPEVYQPETAWLALIAGMAFLGFLLFNWHPAKIFLGESGSLFAGFILGVVSIISGGKIATALLIMGIPIMDVLWVIVRRAFFEKRSPFLADRKHLHLRLLDIGLTQRQVVVLLYLLTGAFGACSLFLHAKAKLIALLVLGAIMVILGIIVVSRLNKRQNR